jgi:hypothetical protein
VALLPWHKSAPVLQGCFGPARFDAAGNLKMCEFDELVELTFVYTPPKHLFIAEAQLDIMRKALPQYSWKAMEKFADA